MLLLNLYFSFMFSFSFNLIKNKKKNYSIHIFLPSFAGNRSDTDRTLKWTVQNIEPVAGTKIDDKPIRSTQQTGARGR